MPENNVTTLPADKVKRQWRVGTFSMGTVLIVFGFVLAPGTVSTISQQ